MHLEDDLGGHRAPLLVLTPAIFGVADFKDDFGRETKVSRPKSSLY